MYTQAGSYDDAPDNVKSVTMAGYVIGFAALFMLSGIGNGSVYKMIPSIFEARSRSMGISQPEQQRWSQAMSGALIGFAGAIGALGGVGINLILRQSYLSSGSATAAFGIFTVYYVAALALTWTIYVRRPVSARVVSRSEPESALA
jgi:MFS transporter, NNP family, nitrate/nitrite transporter